MTRRFLYVGASLATVAATPHIAAQDVSRSRQTAIVTAASRLAPAVVSVNVLRRERQLPQDPFDLFFMPRGSEQVVEGYGSGFVISPDGVVITNRSEEHTSELQSLTNLVCRLLLEKKKKKKMQTSKLR